MKKMLLFSLLVIFTLIFVACSPATITDNATNPGADSDSTAQDEKQTPEELIEGFFAAQPQYSVTYDVEKSFLGTTQESTAKVYEFNNKRRIDYISKAAQFRYYTLPPSHFMCTLSGDWKCFDAYTDESEDHFQLFNDLYEIEQNFAKYDVLEISSKTLGGKESRCFLLKHPDFNQELCVYNNVVMYYSSGNKGSTFVARATSIDMSASTSDFSLPADVQHINNQV
ncbi:MAG: hypothetical protein ACOCQQ_01565 [Candidatus Nanoarchaeia archaeon]